MNETAAAGITQPPLDTSEQRIQRFGAFLRRYYTNDIAELAKHYPNEQRSLTIDFNDLFIFDDGLADDLRFETTRTRTELESAIERFDLPVDITLSDVQVRVRNVEDGQHVSDLQRRENLNQLNGFTGQVTKVSAVKEKFHVIPFECQICGTISRIPQTGTSQQQPHECNGCERRGPFHKNINETQSGDVADHQLMRIQEPPDQTKGAQGRTIDIFLEDDLVDIAKPGDRIRGTGILEIDHDEDSKCVFDTQIIGNHIETEETDFEDVDTLEYENEIKDIAAGERGDPYELLVDSIAPSHYGGGLIKKAIGLQLFGGVAKQQPDGSYQRGDSHILLLGDPGSGKSSFLQTVREIAPRASYVSGKGASAAGLTAAAVSDDFGDASWSLEAGALVLADGGIACVDEIDKMQEDAVKSMHEALEAQEVHISKAGINAKLSARTALLAAGNPKDGRFDPYKSNGEQIALDPALVNRFDLMFMVDDQPDPEEDFETARHIIRRRREPTEPAVDQDVLRAWIAYAKQRCEPTFESAEIETQVSDWYAEFRKAGVPADAPVPMNARNLQAVVRLAEASARVRLSDTVQQEDIERAIDLVTETLRQVGYDDETGQYDVDTIETGQSKSQRDRVTSVRDIVREHEPIQREELFEQASDLGISRKKTSQAMDKLRQEGDVYSLNDGEGFRYTENL